MRRLILTAALLSLSVLIGPAAGQDWRSPVGPDGVTRIIVEAEDMQGVRQDAFGGGSNEWRVGRGGIDHYQSNTFGGHWQSRTRTAMTDAGDNQAAITTTLDVPTEGTYKLWVKYECPPNYNYAFDVSIRRAGSSGAEVFRKTYGLLKSPKHFSFTDTLTAGSLYWSWGIDHDAAEGYDVKLASGKHTLTIEKTVNPSAGGMRSIDAMMLTSDLAPISTPRMSRYPLLDELRRANRVFMRYRAAANSPAPLLIHWNRWGKRYNDFYSPNYTELVRGYQPDGAPLAAGDPRLKNAQLTAPIPPGQTSIWLDVGPCLNVESAATFECIAQAVDAEGKPLATQPDLIPFAVDFALAPQDQAVVASFSVAPNEKGGALTFLLQPDLNTAEGIRYSRKLVDIYRDVAAELDRTPRKARGLPKRMRFYGSTGAISYGAAEQDWSWRTNLDFRHALGLNTVQGSALALKPADYERLKKYYREKGDLLTPSAYHHHSQDPDDVAQKVQALGTAAEFYYLSYGDEIGLPAVNVDDPALLADFHIYMKSEGVTPQALGLAGWEQVKPLASLSADVAVKIGVLPEAGNDAAVGTTLKRLYWHSTRFRIHKGVEDFAAKTRRLRQLVGPHVHASANLGGMHPFYWVHQSSFIEAFKHEAMTMAWTEDYDYCQPESSRLVAEYLAGYLKCGAKYHGQRMMFYCMPHYPGNSPEHLLQNAVLEWGQNVKDLDWFSIPPDGFTTENYVNVRGGMPTFQVIRQVSDMAALVEDWLDPAGAVDAPVAMLLSEASDLWEVGGRGQGAVTPGSDETNAFQEERKNTFYVLRNAGYRVDLITEDDAREGFLKRYKALYIGGENMERATARAIADWVSGGGILYASVGAARKDEYDEPLDVLDEFLGRGAATQYERYQGALRSKIELPTLEPLDTVKSSDGQTFSALASRERFPASPGAEVLAVYGDGSAAMVTNTVGKGRGYYIGTMPATAWVKKALPVMPCGKGGPEKAADGSPRYPSFEPVDFDAAAGSTVLRPLTQASIQPDVRANRPHVVCNRLAGPRGTVITAVNLGMQQKWAVTDLHLEIDGIKSATKVWSYSFPDGLPFQTHEGVLTIQMPKLELADVIVIATGQ